MQQRGIDYLLNSACLRPERFIIEGIATEGLYTYPLEVGGKPGGGQSAGGTYPNTEAELTIYSSLQLIHHFG
jgi:hypothetical protein